LPSITSEFIRMYEIIERLDVFDIYKQLKTKFHLYMKCMKDMYKIINSNENSQNIIKRFIPKFKFVKNNPEAGFKNIVKKMKECLELNGVHNDRNELQEFLKCEIEHYSSNDQSVCEFSENNVNYEVGRSKNLLPVTLVPIKSNKYLVKQ
jgi:hypothetical protein